MSVVTQCLFLGTDQSVLTEGEMNELRSLALRQEEARANKYYEISDRLRAELMAWGAWPPEQGWHAVAEAPDHRQARLARR